MNLKEIMVVNDIFQRGRIAIDEYVKEEFGDNKDISDLSAFSLNDKAFERIVAEFATHGYEPGFIEYSALAKLIQKMAKEKKLILVTSLVIKALKTLANEKQKALNSQSNDKKTTREWFLPPEALAFYFLSENFDKLNYNYEVAQSVFQVLNDENHSALARNNLTLDELKKKIKKSLNQTGVREIECIIFLSSKVLNIQDLQWETFLNDDQYNAIDFYQKIIDNFIASGDKASNNQVESAIKSLIDNLAELNSSYKSPSEYLKPCKKAK